MRIKYPKSEEKPPFQTFAEVERQTKNATPKMAAQLWECVFLTLREIAELLDYVKEHASQRFVYPMFVLAAHTGARRAEIMRLKVRDVDFDSNLITIHERKKSHEKRTTRRVPISPQLRQVLEKWVAVHPGGEQLFCHDQTPTWRTYDRTDNDNSVTADEAHDQFKGTLAATKWSRLRGWHLFRHSFCSNCAARGIDQRIIDNWAGHLSEEMVRRRGDFRQASIPGGTPTLTVNSVLCQTPESSRGMGSISRSADVISDGSQSSNQDGQ